MSEKYILCEVIRHSTWYVGVTAVLHIILLCHTIQVRLEGRICKECPSPWPHGSAEDVFYTLTIMVRDDSKYSSACQRKLKLLARVRDKRILVNIRV